MEAQQGEVGKKTTKKLSKEDIERIKKVVEDFRPGFHPNPRVEFKGRFLFKRHCGARTARVTATDLMPERSGEIGGARVHHVEVFEVCVKCLGWHLVECGID